MKGFKRLLRTLLLSYISEADSAGAFALVPKAVGVGAGSDAASVSNWDSASWISISGAVRGDVSTPVACHCAAVRMIDARAWPIFCNALWSRSWGVIGP